MRISDWSSDVCSSDLIPVTIGASVESDQFGNEARIGRLGFRSGGFEMQPLSLPQAMEHSVDASWGLVRMMATGVAQIVVGDRSIRELGGPLRIAQRSEEHTSELQSLMRISYAVFCLKKKNTHITQK